MRCVEVIYFDIGDKDELTVHQRATRGRGWIPNLHRWKDYSGSRLVSTVRRQVGNFDGLVQQYDGAELGRHRAAGGIEDVLQVRKVPIHLENLLAALWFVKRLQYDPLCLQKADRRSASRLYADARPF